MFAEFNQFFLDRAAVSSKCIQKSYRMSCFNLLFLVLMGSEPLKLDHLQCFGTQAFLDQIIHVLKVDYILFLHPGKWIQVILDFNQIHLMTFKVTTVLGKKNHF